MFNGWRCSYRTTAPEALPYTKLRNKLARKLVGHGQMHEKEAHRHRPFAFRQASALNTIDKNALQRKQSAGLKRPIELDCD